MSRGRRRRRARSGVVLAVVVLALAVGTFFVGRWSAPLHTDSRSDDASVPDVLVAAVERRITLSVDVTATVRPAAQTVLPLVAPAGVARSVVTSTRVRVGDTVRAGQVLLALSGQPLIVLAGREPAYRDLGTGDSGPDVRQLQRALRGLGYPADADGTFGARTGAGVRALFRAGGYPVDRATGPSVRVPASELAFVPHLPAELAALPVAVGADPTGRSIVIDSRTAGAVVAQLSATASAGVPLHTPVLLHCAGREVRGRVAGAVADPSASGSPTDSDGDPGSATDLVSRAVTVGTPLPPSSVGSICPGTATVSITATPVLAVPASAVYDTADHGTVVHLRAHGATTTVSVTVGRAGGGWLELRDPPASVGAGSLLVAGSGGP